MGEWREASLEQARSRGWAKPLARDESSQEHEQTSLPEAKSQTRLTVPSQNKDTV